MDTVSRIVPSAQNAPLQCPSSVLSGADPDGILHIVLPAPQQQKALPANPNLIEIE